MKGIFSFLGDPLSTARERPFWSPCGIWMILQKQIRTLQGDDGMSLPGVGKDLAEFGLIQWKWEEYQTGKVVYPSLFLISLSCPDLKWFKIISRFKMITMLAYISVYRKALFIQKQLLPDEKSFHGSERRSRVFTKRTMSAQTHSYSQGNLCSSSTGLL